MKTFKVNEVFYSLQGEGRNTGRAAVFIRFAGCNLRCPFCDTEFDSYREMNEAEILNAIADYPSSFIVLTGGEPTLQVDEAFVDLLHQHGYEVAMESNGTRPAPENLDWLTVSPKKSLPQSSSKECGESDAHKNFVRQPDEIKMVFTSASDIDACLNQFPLSLEGGGGRPLLLYLQPCDTGDAGRNARILKDCIAYIEAHPQWRLSLQTHKLINIK